jgi:hypothetical protein
MLGLAKAIASILPQLLKLDLQMILHLLNPRQLLLSVLGHARFRFSADIVRQ